MLIVEIVCVMALKIQVLVHKIVVVPVMKDIVKRVLTGMEAHVLIVVIV